MVNNKRYSTLYLAVRSLWPSTTSVVLCTSFALITEATHLLLLSLNIGTSLPAFLDGQWAMDYTNYVVEPLQSFFSNTTFNNILLIVLWGIAGLGTYFIVEYSMYLQSGWRQAQNDVQMVGERQYVYHPMRRTFFLTVLWRSGVLVVAAAVFILAQPWLQAVLRTDPRLINGLLPVWPAVRELTLALLGWILVAHCFVVFLRLFLMRTRLFGDPAIE